MLGSWTDVSGQSTRAELDTAPNSSRARCAILRVGLARFGALTLFPILLALAGTARSQPFDDLSTGLGLPLARGSGPLIAGVTFADLDGDGSVELIRSGATHTVPEVYVRTSLGAAFALAPTKMVLPSSFNPTTGHTLFDFDGDGDLDALILRPPNSFLFENRAGVFVDVTAQRLPSLEGAFMSAAAADFDGDGDLDLALARHVERSDFPENKCQSNLLYENDGGIFVDVSVAAGFEAVKGCSLIVVAQDIDGDRRLDITFINDFGQYGASQEVWLNQGHLAFRETAEALGLNAHAFGMGLAFGDLDENGRRDALITNIGEVALLEESPDGIFEDAQDRYGATLRFASDQNLFTWATTFEDIDVDGYLDALLAAGNTLVSSLFAGGSKQQSLMLRGDPSGRLLEVPLAEGFADSGHSARDIAFEDLDGDGRVEVVLAHVTGKITAHRSRVAVARPTELTLIPALTGAGAAGARVIATCEGVARTRWVNGGGFYGNADRGVVRLSWPGTCASAEREATALVAWPSGFISTHAMRTASRSEVVEPRWLTFESTEDGLFVRIDLSAHAESVEVLELEGDGLAVGPLEQTGASQWRAAVGVEPGRDEGMLIMTVDGEEWPVAPKVAAPDKAPRPSFVPPHPIVGSACEVWTRPFATVIWNGAEYVADAVGRAVLPAAQSVGSRIVEVLTEGPNEEAQMGLWTVNVAPKVSIAKSEIVVRDHVIRATDRSTKTATLRLRLLNENDVLSTISQGEIGLELNGRAWPITATREGDWWVLRLPQRDLWNDDILQVTLAGQPAFEPQRISQVVSIDRIGERIDPMRSRCVVTEPYLWTDGEDIGSLAIMFRDAAGQKLPDFGQRPVPIAANVTLGTPQSLGLSTFLLPIQMGRDEPQLSLTLGLPVTPIPCNIRSRARPNLPDAVSASVTDLGFGVATVGVSRKIRVVPWGPEGRGLGSGVPIAIGVDRGEVSVAPAYVGLGRYELTVLPRAEPDMVVYVSSNGRELGRITIGTDAPNMPADPGPEPSAEVSEPAEVVEVEEVVEVVEVVEVNDAALTDTHPAVDALSEVFQDADLDKDLAMEVVEIKDEVLSDVGPATELDARAEDDLSDADSGAGPETDAMNLDLEPLDGSDPSDATEGAPDVPSEGDASGDPGRDGGESIADADTQGPGDASSEASPQDGSQEDAGWFDDVGPNNDLGHVVDASSSDLTSSVDADVTQVDVRADGGPDQSTALDATDDAVLVDAHVDEVEVVVDKADSASDDVAVLLPDAVPSADDKDTPASPRRDSGGCAGGSGGLPLLPLMVLVASRRALPRLSGLRRRLLSS